MGREVKRVALDFSWPLGKTWDGFLNPHYRKCPDCTSGATVAHEILSAAVSLILIAGEDAAVCEDQKRRTGRIWPHPYLRSIGCHSFSTVSPDAAEMSTGLAGRAPSFMGHDAIDQWAATRKIIEAAGLDPKVWGICKTCGGDAIDPTIKAAYEAWKPTEPPAGDGWQVWETVSEGSPVTPVFPTSEELILHLAENGDDWDQKRGSGGWGIASASAFVGVGWTPSMAVVDGHVVDGKDIPLELGGR